MLDQQKRLEGDVEGGFVSDEEQRIDMFQKPIENDRSI